MAIIMLIFYIAVAVLAISIVQLWRERKCPPGPCGLPILGYLPFLNAKSPYKTLNSLADKYGSIYTVRLGNVLTVVVASATLVREFLKRDEFLGRAPLYVTHGIMGGYGLICAEGALWKDQRRHCIDGLKCLGMTKKMGESRANLESRIRQKVNECLTLFENDSAILGAFDPLPALEHTLGNIINEIVFGLSYERHDPTWRYLLHLQHEGLKLIGVSGVVNFLPFLRFLPQNKIPIQFLLKGKANTHAIYDRIIEKCRQEMELSTSGKTVRKSSMLQCFLEERERRLASPDIAVRQSAGLYYNQIQLRHFLADLFGAGMDTTLTTLRWLLLYMAKYKNCQANLQRHLHAGISNNVLTLRELENLGYLRACIAEVQRIRPVVPMGIPHGTERACEINGYLIPKGAMILPLQWAIHMDVKVWPEPEEFRPERFLDDNGEYYQPSSFMPFQSGKRICLGDELARMMLLLYTGLIFNNYTVQLAPCSVTCDMIGESGITLAPHPYKVVLTKTELSSSNETECKSCVFD